MNKRVEVFRRFVADLATLSKCEKRQVAAIITDKSLTQVYSIGINGGPRGLADCLCSMGGRYGCVHAEINALSKCNCSDTDKVMFITLSPCVACAAAIVNSGFSKVYYLEEWKDTAGLKILQNANISVIHLHNV